MLSSKRYCCDVCLTFTIFVDVYIDVFNLPIDRLYYHVYYKLTYIFDATIDTNFQKLVFHEERHFLESTIDTNFQKLVFHEERHFLESTIDTNFQKLVKLTSSNCYLVSQPIVFLQPICMIVLQD